MQYLTFITVSLLLGLAFTAPTKTEEYKEKHLIYTAEYDIDSLTLSMISLKTQENDNNEVQKSIPALFFALADYTDGKREDKGFYIRKASGEVTKLLDHGRDAVGILVDTGTAYIAADDGIYTYKSRSNKAEKYGTVTDDLISIAKVNGSDILYVLTKDHTLYNVTDEGTKKDKVIDINPEQVVLDNENNLYYVASNQVKVYNPKGSRNIEGLPEKITNVKLLRPPIFLDKGVILAVDNIGYIAYPNGTSRLLNVNIRSRAIVFSLEGSFVLFTAEDKKIYEYNILKMLLERIFSKLNKSIEGLIIGSNSLIF